MCRDKRAFAGHVKPLRTLTPILAALVIAFAPMAAVAATPGAPDAGSILQQIQPVTPPAPSSSGTGLKIERETAAGLPASAPFEVQSIAISGNTVFDTPTLHALVADFEGKSLTLSQVGELADRITDYYRTHGYPLARAIIPAQTIQSGSVRIEVIEARYGRISLENRSRVTGTLLEATLSPLQSGQGIAQVGLDRALLLLSDVPGVVIAATLKPGEAVGTSDLLVNTEPGPAFSAHVVADNYGNRFTGRARVGGAVNFINPLGHGDVLTASVLGSGSGLQYGRLVYESALNGRGTRAGGSYSYLDYSVSGSLDPLDAHGTAQVASLWAKHPFVRQRDVNVYGQIQLDRLQLRDHVGATSLRTDRNVEVWTASVTGDVRDTLLTSAVSTWNVGWSEGHVGFVDAAAESADAATARTRGGYSKWQAGVTRQQILSPKTTLYLSLSGQWASENLDSSQKMSAGGPYSVRAYDVGAISGDTGYLGTVELRHDLGFAYGRWQATAFVDSARIRVNESPFAAGTNNAKLHGAGVSLTWAGPASWHARAYIARRIGSTPALITDTASTRAGIEAGKGF